MENKLTNEIKDFALAAGADLAGIADLARIRGIDTIPADLLSSFTTAVVIAFQLSPEIFRQMVDEPTALYAHQYAAVNQLLDQINLRLQSKLLDKGYKALAIPAAQTLDRQTWLGHISVKAVAKAAGLGWQGRSSLLVTPQYGPRVRLACLLTDAPLAPDPVTANRCGGCTKCREACPAGAIHGSLWTESPNAREEALDLPKCVDRLRLIAQRQGREAYICGICIKVCPWGRSSSPS